MKPGAFSLLLCLLLCLKISSPTQAQIKKHKADITYPNGQLKFKGRYIKCLVNNPQHPASVDRQERKIGKWTAYNPDGSLKEIRFYTQKVKNCNSKIYKEDEWKFFNKEGTPYLSEKYRNDTLVYSELEIYENGSLIGKLIKTKTDAKYQLQVSTSMNLIPNPSFDQYYYEPSLVYDGKNAAEKMLPFWYSPDNATPDYYNTNKTVAGIPAHFNDSGESTEMDGYLGLMFYRGPRKMLQRNLIAESDLSNARTTAEGYSESVQAKLHSPLKKGQLYCFKTSIRLSKNAGYSINRFGVILSEKQIRFGYLKAPKEASLSFSGVFDNTKEWQIVCSAYRAKGGESFLTLGRFSNLNQLKPHSRIPDEPSSLDVNRSAYYLFNDLSMRAISSSDECQCNSENVEMASSDSVKTNTYFELGKPFVIGNLEFDTDKAIVTDSFIPGLQRLLSYLLSHKSVNLNIAGHTDSDGDTDYNLELSIKRAIVIRDWLVSQGVEPSRLKTEGFGNARPISKNNTKEHKKRNRRVEFVLSVQ